MEFDDYLYLRHEDFTQTRFIIFYGESGSGKSSYIHFLRDNNSSFGESDIGVIDEIFDFKSGLKKLSQFPNTKHILIASHMPYWYFFPLRFFGKILFYRIDTNHKKICNYLTKLGLSFSNEVVSEYILRFGATYTDIDIIIEGSKEKSFDVIFQNFIAHNILLRAPSISKT